MNSVASSVQSCAVVEALRAAVFVHILIANQEGSLDVSH